MPRTLSCSSSSTSISDAPLIMRRTRASSRSSSSSSARLDNTACEEPSVPIQVASSTSSSADTFLASQDEYSYGQHLITDDDDSFCHCPYKILIIVIMVYVMVGMLKVRSSDTSKICIFMALQI